MMNKGELVDAIAEKADVTKKDADSILTATLDTIVDNVKSAIAIGNATDHYAIRKPCQEGSQALFPFSFIRFNSI